MINRDNYHAVMGWLKYLADVKQVSPATLKVRRAQTRHILEWADETPFADAPKIKPSLPRYLAQADGNRDGKPLEPQTAARDLSDGAPILHLGAHWTIADSRGALRTVADDA